MDMTFFLIPGLNKQLNELLRVFVILWANRILDTAESAAAA
jgi:hypothetical protein